MSKTFFRPHCGPSLATAALCVLLGGAAVATQDKLPPSSTGMPIGKTDDVVFINISLKPKRKPPERFSLGVGDKEPARDSRDLLTAGAVIERLKKETRKRKGQPPLVIRAQEDVTAGVIRDLLEQLMKSDLKIQPRFFAVREEGGENNDNLTRLLETPLPVKSIPKDAAKTTVRVKATRNGDQTTVLVEGKAIPLGDLAKQLGTYARDPERRSLLLEFDHKVPHRVIIQILDAARLGGMNRVSVLVP